MTEATNRRLFAFNKTNSRLDVSFSVGAGTPLDIIMYDANPQESCESYIGLILLVIFLVIKLTMNKQLRFSIN